MIFLRFESNHGHKFTFNIKNTLSLLDVEAIIYKKLIKEDVYFSFFLNGKELIYTSSLADQGIHTFHLIRIKIVEKNQDTTNPISIIVRELTGRELIYTISELAKVSELKEKILSKIGLVSNRQKLFYQRKQLKNKYCLKNYDIKNGSVICLVAILCGCNQLFPKNIQTGKIYCIPWHGSKETVKDLKKNIIRKINNANYYQDFTLKYLGNNLSDFKTLTDYDIKNESQLHFSFPPNTEENKLVVDVENYSGL